MKVLTYNIRSWYRDTDSKQPTYWKKRAKQIRELIEKEDPDVILLQEALWPMRQRCVPKGYSKVKGFSVSHHIYLKDGFADVEGRSWHIHYTTAKIRTKDARRFTIISVHSTWKSGANKRTCEAIFKLSRNQSSSLIAGGDWNNEPRDEYREVFPLEVVNSQRITFQNWKDGTFGELDYFVVPAWGRATAKVVEESRFGLSDHLPVTLTL